MEETDQLQTPGLEVTEEPTQDPLLAADSEDETTTDAGSSHGEGKHYSSSKYLCKVSVLTC